MKNRQGSVWISLVCILILLVGSGCQSDQEVEAGLPTETTTPTHIVATPTQFLPTEGTATPTLLNPTTVAATPTSKAVAVCEEVNGIVTRETIHSKVLPGRMVFSLYLPPCYDPVNEYPVLYLFHGLTYTDDQWIRLGAVNIADSKISQGQLPSFIMVFPYNPNPVIPSDSNFSQAVLETLVPWVDENYAHCSRPACRWIGGLSRGGGWAFDIFMQNGNTFGKLGGHSPSLFTHDLDRLSEKMQTAWHGEPIWIDVGQDDKEARFLQALTDRLTQDGMVLHFSEHSGNHEESYWQAHLEEYLDWYTGSGTE